MSACSRIGRPFLAGMGRTRCLGDIRPRAGAWVNEFLFLESLKSLQIEVESTTLNDRIAIPVEAEPFKVFANELRGARLDARRIDVFNPQWQRATPRTNR